VEEVVCRVGEVTGSNHVGTYLHGSLAQGSFYPPKSDVDVLVVLRDALGPAEQAAFVAECVSLSRQRPITGDLECTAILADVARAPVHPTPVEARYSEGHSVEELLAVHESPDVVVYLRAVRESGVVLSGSSIEDVIGCVDGQLFRQSISEDIDWILDGANLVESPFYGILNLCRALWVWTGESG
jgi:streptomycin 3"-adenylyltransferase